MSDLLGIDVSKWQREMDWGVASAAGAKFAFIRAGSISSTTGIPYTDYQFETNARVAPDHMPVGYYFYFRPQWPADEQAEYFCNLIKDKRQSLSPVLDLESSWGMTAEQITEAAKIFITEVYVRLGVWCLLYSRGAWLNAFTVDDAVWDFVELWIARYEDSLDGPWSDGYYKPDNFDDWRFWQFSAGGNGRGAEFGAKSASIDLNYFNGDQAAFDAYVKAAPAIPEIVKVIEPAGTVIRKKPWSGARLRIEPWGALLGVIEAQEDDNNLLWYRIGQSDWVRSDQVNIVE